MSQWTQLEYTEQHHQRIRPRLWHSGMRTKQNEVVIVGGSSTGNVDGYCNDLLVFSFEPRSLKRLALEAVARAKHLVTRDEGIPLTLIELIRSREKAIASANQ